MRGENSLINIGKPLTDAQPVVFSFAASHAENFTLAKRLEIFWQASFIDCELSAAVLSKQNNFGVLAFVAILQ